MSYNGLTVSVCLAVSLSVVPQVFFVTCTVPGGLFSYLAQIGIAMLTHRGPVDLRKWAIFNTILMSPKSWLSQEDLDAGCEHSMVPVDS